MIFGLFTLLVALTISGVAAYYSIAGLCAIFAAAVTPVIIMGAALELGKITATVWLHRFWHRANIQFKLYLIPAIVILMIITSMGIFGFLSKAHMDQSVTVGDSAAQVQILDEKIKTEQDNIASAKKALGQMDSQVDQMLSRTTDDKGTNRAVQIRKNQAGERKNLQKEITDAQKHIAELQNERAPLAAQSRKIEAEVGPIKYIAALIYGDNPDANLLERAVRWVIILLVLVFDPLALVLILAAEQTIEWARTDRKEAKKPEGWHQEWVPDSEAWPEWDDEITDEQYEAIRQEANVNDDIEMKQFFETGKELAKEIDANSGYLNKEWKWPEHNDSTVGLVPKAEEPVVITQFTNPESDPDLVADIPVLENEETWAQRVIDEELLPNTNQEFHDPEPIRGVVQRPADDPEPLSVGYGSTPIHIPDFSIAENEPILSQAGFGTTFPSTPNRGDMFLRVDYLPSRLYKWNEKKWIEVDKEKTDHFAYDQEYIRHLIEKIDLGEYDIDLLTTIEEEQIQRYLNDTNKRQ